MKRLLAFTLGLALFVLLVPGMRAHAATVDVFVNGTKIQSDQPAFLDSQANRTFVPLRFVAEALGSDVDWDGGNQTAVVKTDNTEITMKIGSNRPAVNGSVVTIDAPARLMNGRTMVPLRFVSEVQGANVEWVGQERAVYINTGDVPVQPPVSQDVVQFKGVPVNPNDYTVDSDRKAIPATFEFPGTEIMHTTIDQLRRNPIKLGDEQIGWSIIYDIRIENDRVYITEDSSGNTPIPIVLAKGNDLSAQRSNPLVKYTEKPFTHGYLIHSDASPVKIEEVTHIILMSAFQIISIENPKYTG